MISSMTAKGSMVVAIVAGHFLQVWYEGKHFTDLLVAEASTGNPGYVVELGLS